MNIISLILSFILGSLLMFLVFCLVAPLKENKLKNNIHFYVARDKNTILYLYLGKPERAYYAFRPCENGYCFVDVSVFRKFGLNPDDFKDLKWEDEPLEVFINMED